MKIAKLISPFASQLLTSQTASNTARAFREARRKRQHRPHKVTFYYRADDPYSFLLLQKMKQFKKDFAIELECRVVPRPPIDGNPTSEQQEHYALKDARNMAKLWRLNFPAIRSTPSKVALFTLNQILTAQIDTDDFIQAALQAGRSFWHKDFAGLRNARQTFGGLDKSACQALLASNAKALEKQGSLMSGMLYYEGEGYWGLDRLHYLVTRLIELGINQAPVDVKFYTSMTQLGQLPSLNRSPQDSQGRPSGAPHELDFYFSFRSPYAYLAIERTINLCKLYNLTLNIKPVLPLVMRGLSVPRKKQLYIMRDAAREASLYHIPFGKVVDPLGKGVEQCLAAFEYAAAEGQEQAFLLAAGKGIWSQGIDVSTRKGLQRIVEASGLNWQTIQPYLTQEHWRQRVEKNQQELFALGLWGVPSFRLGGYSAWGQDRIDYLDRLLAEAYAHQTFPARNYSH